MQAWGEGQARPDGLASQAALLRQQAERVLERQLAEDALVEALGGMVDGRPPQALQRLIGIAAAQSGPSVAGAALRSQIHAAAMRCSEEHVGPPDGRRSRLFAVPLAIAGPQPPRHRDTALTGPQQAAIAHALHGAQLRPGDEPVLLPWLLSAHEAMFLTLGEVHLLKLHLCAGRFAAARELVATATSQRDAAARAHLALVAQTELRLQDHVVLLVGMAGCPDGAGTPFLYPHGGPPCTDATQRALADAIGCALELLKPAAAWSANVPGCSALPCALGLEPVDEPAPPAGSTRWH